MIPLPCLLLILSRSSTDLIREVVMVDVIVDNLLGLRLSAMETWMLDGQRRLMSKLRANA